jgi:ribosomal-protein-alanine N-acetyltransferase
MLDVAHVFAAFPTLETERFVLRALAPTDAPALLRIMGDPLVTRYFGRGPMETLDEAAEQINKIQLAFAAHEGIRWAITRRGEDHMLGSCGFWRLVLPHFTAEIGYELGREHWGQGIMPEVARAVLGYGFATIGLHRVEAQIHPANGGSRRVLEKLGFVQEGYFRQHYYEPAEGIFTDTAVFSLLKADWVVPPR